MKKIEVVAGIIQYENTILCVQRPAHKRAYISKKYEFPGGKIEAGETHKEALARELQEELELEVIIGELFLTVVHPYPDFELTMHSYLCQCSSQNITLNEHIDAKWLKKDELLDLDWAGADVPIVARINVLNDFLRAF